jgi:hypothetical protein
MNLDFRVFGNSTIAPIVDVVQQGVGRAGEVMTPVT